jgi:peptidoglycan/LPS O-acetylase OafA/YrhL
MRDRSRQAVLEGARGLLVGGIVGYHALRLLLSRNGSNWGDVSALWWWAGTGRFGVDAFFVLAGFLVVGSWRSCRARATSTLAAARDFASRRAWRILPPYLAMLVVLVPMLAPELFRPEGWRDLLRLVTVQQYLDVHLPASVNVPIWSLTTEVHFYVLAPLIAWLLAKLGGWKVWVVAAPFALWWVESTFRGELAASLLPGRIDQFVLGAAAAGLLARVAAGQRSRLVDVLTTRAALPVLTIALLAVGTYHGATFQHPTESVLPDLVHPVAAVVLAGLLVRLVAGGPVRLLEHPVMVWLGGISFSLYLWHYPILDQGLRLTGAMRGPAPQAALTGAVLIVLAIGVAWVSHQLVEVPAAARRSRRPASLPVVQAELGLEDAQEVARAERHDAGGSLRRGADHPVALGQLAQVATVDAERGGTMARH